MGKKTVLRNRQLTIVGGSMGFIIPMPIARNEGIEKGKVYNITVEEVDLSKGCYSSPELRNTPYFLEESLKARDDSFYRGDGVGGECA